MTAADYPGLGVHWTVDGGGLCTEAQMDPAGLLPPLAGVPLVRWLAAAHPEDGPPVALELAAALAQRLPFRHEMRVCCRDGRPRHVVVQGLPHDDGGYRGALVDVTVRRELLARALRSEAEHRLIFDNSTDLIAHCDPQGNYVLISPSYLRVCGWSNADMAGKPVVDFLHPYDREAGRVALTAVLEGRPADMLEVRKRTRAGGYITVGTSARRVVEPDTGRCLGAVLVSRDITHEKEMLRQLRAMAGQNEAFIENSPDIMLLLDAQGTILKVNQAIHPVLGYAPQELVGQAGLDYIRFDTEREAARRMLQQSWDAGYASSVVGCRRKDGSLVQVSLSMRRPPGADVIYASARDVTDSHATRQALQKSHAQVRTLLESIDDGFFSVNGDWQLTYANMRAADFVGADRDASIGKVLWDLAPGLRESTLGGLLRDAMAQRRSTTFELWYEPAGVWVSERVYAHEDGLSVFFHDISERKEAEARLERLATRDTLTGLPNRAWINRRVDSMLAGAQDGNCTTVFFIDLNRFKAINDSMGHATGDRLLQQVGERLQASLRPADVVARLGGDEFVVAAGCADRAAAAGIAQRLIDALAVPFLADGLEMCVGASIGIGMAGAGAQTTAQLFQNADTAMYQAKALGGGTYRFFEPEMSIAAKRRLKLEVALPRALEHGELALHFQPRVDLRTLRTRGMEALLRWTHPELGPVSPLEFIPIAEERGHIVPIGRWVLREACREARRINERHGLALHVSVNVSARQLRSAELVGDVTDALARSGLAAGCLELEITESALIDDIDGSARTLRSLKALGVRLSLDDFGTGYSSLAYLKRFPVDVLKLDRSFVEGEAGADNSDFIAALIGMAHALNLSVVAEGIETEAVLDTLHGARCDEGQGYLFARPLAVADFEAFLLR